MRVKFQLLKLWHINVILDEYLFVGPSSRFSHGYVILNCLGQVLYLGRAPRTKETLLDFREKCRVTRHSLAFPRVDG